LGLSTLTASIGALAFAATPALADIAPTVTINPASAVAYTTAHVTGTVNPNGGPSATAWIFEYSKNPLAEGWTPAFGGEFTGAEATGKSPVAVPIVPAMLEGLQPNTIYQVRLVATNAGGEGVSAEPNPSFTTKEVAKPTVAFSSVSSVTASSAHFSGTVNPNAPGPAPQDPAFDSAWHFECTPECPGLAGGVVLADNSAHEVAADTAGLLPHTKYEVSLLASNLGGQATAGPQTFTTPAGAPQITESNVSDVASTSATFAALVNPEGAATSYVFEYAPAGGAFTPVPEAEGAGSLPEGTSAVSVSVHVQHGLLPNTAYQFRVTATNSVETVKGEAVSFSTQTAAGGFALADGRQWELVSPPDKHGALISSLSRSVPIQAAVNGSAITYGASGPTEAEPPGYGQQGAFFGGQVLSTRGGQGWSTHDITSPHSAPAYVEAAFEEFLFFSPDLSFGLAQPLGRDYTLLSPQASEPTAYVRREGLCDVPASAAECYLPILTGKEGFADVPAGTTFGQFRAVEFQGASPDLRHVLLNSSVALTKTPIERIEGASSPEAVYEWSAGVPAGDAVQLVSLFPPSEGGGTDAHGVVGPSDGNYTPAGIRHSIADDGSRVFWHSRPAVAESGGGVALYMRDTTRNETVRLDLRLPGAPAGASEAQFQAASADGSRAFFTDPQPLTPQSGQRNSQFGDLYECRIVEEAGHLVCKLTDLTPGSESAEVQNVLSGVAEDGSYVYFVANGVLGDGAARGATRGTCSFQLNPLETCNLYKYHAGAITFIATLSVRDQTDWAGGSPHFGHLGTLTAQASASGRYLAFMSDRSLTGYDNRDAVSGKPDAEVFLYDAATGRLVCASCNPTGGRPVGVAEREFVSSGGPHGENLVGFPELEGRENETTVAANLPVGSWITGNAITLHQPRYLTDTGRLFFNSSDALVPQAVNHQENVYEFERAGVGSCSPSSTTYVASSGGCVSLVSSGTSGEESGFLDASATGPGGEEAEDVFFVTSSSLSPLDKDTARDVYDAHVCSTAVPCVTPPALPPPCSTEASCRVAPSPQPGVFGAPASTTFTGVGNVPPGSSPAGKPKTAAQLRAERLARALKACRTKHDRRRRAACERLARKRYGAVRASRSASSHRRASR
jgi:hypothetical protein